MKRYYGVVALLIAFSAFVLWQLRELKTLRQENGILRHALAGRPEEHSVSQDNRREADLDAASEVNRLRNELATLRREKLRLLDAAANQRRGEPVRAAINQESADAEMQKEQHKAEMIGRMNYLKQTILGFHLFAEKHEGSLPSQLADADLFLDESVRNHPSRELFEMVYAGKLADIKEPARTILIRQKIADPAPNGGYVKGYGFADGHSEIHKENAVEGFDKWEQSRLVPAPAPGAVLVNP